MNKLFEKVDMFSIAKPFAVAMGFIGFVIAVIYVVGGIIEDIFIAGRVKLWSDWLKFFAFFPLRILALFLIPAMFGAFGFVVGAIGALLNNLVVALSGRD